MGIAPYKTFTFDGVSSSAYGVYLTGEGVFNAPVRSVEMIAIPGRNGDYALDQGKFEDISVTYKIGMFDVNESNFADKVSAFRNWLCSKVGYVRLSDDYNPNEYRMAVYANGLELDHKFLIAGEATITFTCKPQRWLTSGETATAVANNGTLSNPTLFDSEPLLAVKGYGNISFNGYSIDIENVPLGDVTLAENVSSSTPYTFSVDTSQFNNGDTVSVAIDNFSTYVIVENTDGTTGKPTYQTDTLADSNASFSTSVSPSTHSASNKGMAYIYTRPNVLTFAIGTSSTVTNSVSGTITYKNSGGGSSYNLTVSITQTISYDGTDNEFTFSTSATITFNHANTSIQYKNKEPVNIRTIIGSSTISALGNPTYIDCDIGECYMIKNSEIVSLNQHIDLGSDLPMLASGTNTFTYDNTVTELKVTPRWWKV